MHIAQSRQRAKLLLQSSELGLPQPLAHRRGSPPLFWGGGACTLAGERGVGRVPIPTRGHTQWYSLYIRTLCMHALYIPVFYYSLQLNVCECLLLVNAKEVFLLQLKGRGRGRSLKFFYGVILSVLCPVSPTPCPPTSPLSLQFLNPLRPSRHSTCPPFPHPL
jgi:hypothetical protein